MRLQGYDYSQGGAYFITVCTQIKACLFGEIADGQVVLNSSGQIVAQEWVKSANIRDEIELDEFVVMPNHLHGVVVIHEIEATGDRPVAPTGGLRSKSVGALMAGFKAAATIRINHMRGIPGAKIWQRNYYEHVIRNDVELARVREYIVDNPMRWALDPENPARRGQNTGRSAPE